MSEQILKENTQALFGLVEYWTLSPSLEKLATQESLLPDLEYELFTAQSEVEKEQGKSLAFLRGDHALSQTREDYYRSVRRFLDALREIVHESLKKEVDEKAWDYFFKTNSVGRATYDLSKEIYFLETKEVN